MKGIILLVLSGIGALTGGMKIGDILLFLWDKFHDWRKNGCKIKYLCKPHKYKLVWYQLDTEKAILECEKCEKRKKVFIDYDSIKKEFNLED